MWQVLFRIPIPTPWTPPEGIPIYGFGFMLSTPEALGWSVSDDAMRAVLNPTVDRGLVEVHGTFRGDAIAGTWRYVADPGGAAGTFELKRASR